MSKFSRLKFLSPGRLTDLALFLIYWFAFTILVGTGPNLQQALGSTFSQQAPSLYAAAYGEGVYQHPRFSEWLLFGFDPLLLLPAFLTTVVALTAPTYQKGALRAGIAAPIFISIADTGILVFSDQMPDLGQAIVFNVLAAPFVWLFFILLFMLRRLFVARVDHESRASLFFAASAFGLSIGLSGLLFVLFRIFYDTSPVEFSAVVKAPTEGMFMADTIQRSEEALGSEKPFSILPPNALAGNLGITSAGGRMSARWEKVDPDSSFLVKLSLFADCPHPQNLDDLPKPYVFTTLHPSELTVSMSAGLSHLRVSHDGTRPYNLKVAELAHYWLKSEGEEKITSIDAFIGEKDRISLDPRSGTKFFIGGSLSKVEDNAARSEERSLVLEVDGETTRIPAGGERMVSGRRLNCRPVKDAVVDSKNEDTVIIPRAAEFFSIGVLVEIVDEPVPVDLYRLEKNKLTISGAKGWAEISRFDLPRMTERSLGIGRGFSASENIQRLSIDGAAVQVDELDSIFAVAKVRGRMEDSLLRVEGTASALWLNNRRMNPTTWERLGGWQIPIITMFFGLLGLLVRWLSPRVWGFVRSEDPFPSPRVGRS